MRLCSLPNMKTMVGCALVAVILDQVMLFPSALSTPTLYATSYGNIDPPPSVIMPQVYDIALGDGTAGNPPASSWSANADRFGASWMIDYQVADVRTSTTDGHTRALVSTYDDISFFTAVVDLETGNLHQIHMALNNASAGGYWNAYNYFLDAARLRTYTIATNFSMPSWSVYVTSTAYDGTTLGLRQIGEVGQSACSPSQGSGIYDPDTSTIFYVDSGCCIANGTCNSPNHEASAIVAIQVNDDGSFGEPKIRAFTNATSLLLAPTSLVNDTLYAYQGFANKGGVPTDLAVYSLSTTQTDEPELIFIVPNAGADANLIYTVSLAVVEPNPTTNQPALFVFTQLQDVNHTYVQVLEFESKQVQYTGPFPNCTATQDSAVVFAPQNTNLYITAGNIMFYKATPVINGGGGPWIRAVWDFNDSAPIALSDWQFVLSAPSKTNAVIGDACATFQMNEWVWMNIDRLTSLYFDFPSTTRLSPPTTPSGTSSLLSGSIQHLGYFTRYSTSHPTIIPASEFFPQDRLIWLEYQNISGGWTNVGMVAELLDASQFFAPGLAAPGQMYLSNVTVANWWPTVGVPSYYRIDQISTPIYDAHTDTLRFQASAGNSYWWVVQQMNNPQGTQEVTTAQLNGWPFSTNDWILDTSYTATDGSYAFLSIIGSCQFCTPISWQVVHVLFQNSTDVNPQLTNVTLPEIVQFGGQSAPDTLLAYTDAGEHSEQSAMNFVIAQSLPPFASALVTGFSSQSHASSSPHSHRHRVHVQLVDAGVTESILSDDTFESDLRSRLELTIASAVMLPSNNFPQAFPLSVTFFVSNNVTCTE